MTTAERADVVRDVLRWMISGWVCEEDTSHFRDALLDLSLPPEDWWCCPLCQEVVCDSDCPLYAVRDEAGIWVGSTGALRAEQEKGL